MLRNRLLVGLGVCFLAASGAWADEVGFVDCSKSAEATQVFGKPRRSQDVVASVPCGERFTILVYGFYFSRIQTKDGQVGYVYSSLISQDRGATSLQPAATTPQTSQQTPALQTAAEKVKIPRSTPFDAQPSAAASQPQPATPAVTTQQTAATPASPVQTAAAPASAVEVASAAPTSASSTISSNGTATAAPAAQSASTVVAEPQTTPTRPAATSAPVFTTPPAAPPTPNADAQEATAAAEQPSSDAAAAPPAADQPEAQPEPAAAAPAEPAPAQPAPAKPAAPAIRPADLKESWEKPRPSVRAAPLLELYGGFAFARMGGTGLGGNSIGGLGSVGWNARSWLQVLADTSYNVETVSGAKNVLYGNHYGPRFFYRARNRWGITPFAEALVGGSNFKTTISGSGGYSASTGATLSYKVGGGVDIHPSHRWEIRLIDVDYYKTAFGTDTHQTNYWISTGVVLRLFGGGSE